MLLVSRFLAISHRLEVYFQVDVSFPKCSHEVILFPLVNACFVMRTRYFLSRCSIARRVFVENFHAACKNTVLPTRPTFSDSAHEMKRYIECKTDATDCKNRPRKQSTPDKQQRFLQVSRDQSTFRNSKPQKLSCTLQQIQNERDNQGQNIKRRWGKAVNNANKLCTLYEALVSFMTQV